MYGQINPIDRTLSLEVNQTAPNVIECGPIGTCQVNANSLATVICCRPVEAVIEVFQRIIQR